MSALHFRCQYLHNYITVTLQPFSTSLISRWPAICLSFLHHNYLRDHLSLHHPQDYSICNKNKIHSRNYMNHRNHRNMVLSFSEYVYSQALLLNILYLSVRNTVIICITYCRIRFVVPYIDCCFTCIFLWIYLVSFK